MVASQTGITFAVDDVEPARKALPQVSIRDLHVRYREPQLVACCDVGPVLDHVYHHPLLEAVHLAFSQHRPLILAPDHIWLTIARGIADHMALEGERLRSRFVKHQGRLTLCHEASSSLGEIDWPACFRGWCSQISDYVGQGLEQVLLPDFTTTTEIDRVVGHVVMMDIFEWYFEYQLLCICGIPTVTLRGTPEDWTRLRDKAARLEVFEVGWWLEHLIPVLDQFVLAAQGTPDILFWKRICKLREEYGGDIINGWITSFFPYVRWGAQGPAIRRNQCFGTTEGIQASNAPSALSKVPLKVTDKSGNEMARLEAVGGLVGVRQHANLAVEPQSGWLIRESEPDPLDAFSRTFAPFAVPGGTTKRLDATDDLLPLDLERFYADYSSCCFPNYALFKQITLFGKEESIRRSQRTPPPLPWSPMMLRKIGAAGGTGIVIDLASSTTARDPKRVIALAVGPDPEQYPVVANSFSELAEELIQTKGHPHWIEKGWRPRVTLGQLRGSIASPLRSPS